MRILLYSVIIEDRGEIIKLRRLNKSITRIKIRYHSSNKVNQFHAQYALITYLVDMIVLFLVVATSFTSNALSRMREVDNVYFPHNIRVVPYVE